MPSVRAHDRIAQNADTRDLDLHHVAVGDRRGLPLGAHPDHVAGMQGEGTVEFHRARWEDLPTQYMVVNALSALEIKEYRGASIEHSVGGISLSNQRILH